MENRLAKQYLKNQILNASKQELLLMLFDGAIRFAEQGKAKLQEKKLEESCQLLIRSQRIMIELVTSLDKDVLPGDLYTQLVRLYNFVYFRLIDANLKKDAQRIDEAVRILVHLRDTWSQAVEKDKKERFPEIELIARAQAQAQAVQSSAIQNQEAPRSIEMEG